MLLNFESLSLAVAAHAGGYKILDVTKVLDNEHTFCSLRKWAPLHKEVVVLAGFTPENGEMFRRYLGSRATVWVWNQNRHFSTSLPVSEAQLALMMEAVLGRAPYSCETCGQATCAVCQGCLRRYCTVCASVFVAPRSELVVKAGGYLQFCCLDCGENVQILTR